MSRRPAPARPAQRYRCAECGALYRTLRAAERALARGCRAGCSGIEIYPEQLARPERNRA